MASRTHPLRRLAAGAAVLTLSVSLAACASDDGEEPAAGDVTEQAPDNTAEQTDTADASDTLDTPATGIEISILDYYVDDPMTGQIQGVLDACAADAGVTVSRESVPGGDLIAKVLQQATSKTLPDLLMLDNPDMQEIAATGALTPLGDLGVSSDGFAEGVVSAGTFEDTLYGLAPGVNTLSLFYNTAKFADAGLSPPTTWDELKSTAAALTSADTYGIAFAAPANYEGTWQFLPFFWTSGADETDIATEEAASALQLLKDLVDAGSASEGVLTWTQADAKDQFAAGKAAMMINGPWQIPALAEAADPVEYEVVPIPVPEAGMVSASPLGGEVWTLPVTGDADRQAKAAEVLNCLLSDDTQLELSAAINYIPAKPALKDQFLAQRPEMGGFVDQVATARARTGKLGQAWPATAEALYTALQETLTGQGEPLAALQSAAANLQ